MTRTRAILVALFVTLLWSSSWVLIKTGLEEIPALLFAGLRYSLAFLVLLPFAFVSRGRPGGLRAALAPAHLPKLLLLGLVMYGVTQGAQFVALSYLPAQTTSLLLSFTPIMVAILATAFLSERATPQQWVGMLIYLVGAGVFLYPADFGGAQVIGLAVAVAGLLGNALASVLGRNVNRGRQLSPLTVTVVTMGVGAAALLATGLAVDGLPSLSARSWLTIGWLAVVNTALAFTLWNLSLRTLTATESSVINNTMLIQIAVLAWVFLGESLGVRQIIGLALATAGTLVVQLRPALLLGSAARARTR